jgi:RNA polymerase sigma-70 factor, ECF subfamily
MDETELVSALQAGNELAFAELVDAISPLLLRVAMAHLPNRPLAEDVVQETWLAVIQGIGGFEGRSTVKTWAVSILLNKARTRAEREGRSVPFSELTGAEDEDGPVVSPERFLAPNHPEWPGHWTAPPDPWEQNPEHRLLARETLAQVMVAIESLPAQQRMVMVMRDVNGFPADEVQGLLGLSSGNQRVLLHRARSRVRTQLEAHFHVDGVMS